MTKITDRVDPFVKLQALVEDLVHPFFSHGIPVYVVGGAVRDALLGKEPRDEIDLATPAPPERVKGLYRRCLDVGIKHGTVTALVSRKGVRYQLEITTFRVESGYSDHRHPDRVEFTDELRLDLERRDFTVNAMAWDPRHRLLIDPLGGREDLERRVLRCVGDPYQRFEEDALRIFRLYRFQSQLDFQVDAQTAQAATACSPLCRHVAWERKRLEWGKLLAGVAWIEGREGLLTSGALEIGSTIRRRPPYPDRLNSVPSWVPGRWAYHYWELGQDHEHAEEDLRRFRCSKEEITAVKRALSLLERMSKGCRDPETYLDLWGSRDPPPWLPWLSVFFDSQQAPRITEEILRRLESPVPLFLFELAIGGNDVLALGVQPSPRVRLLLEHALAYQRQFPSPLAREDLRNYLAAILRRLSPKP